MTSFNELKDKNVNTIIIGPNKKNSELVYMLPNKYYIGKVCSGQISKAFALATTTVKLLMGRGFICKTSYRGRTIYLSIITGREYTKILTIKLIYKNLIV